MTDEAIKVYVVSDPGRSNLVMRYRDPITGRTVKRSAGTANRKQAEKAAAKWEAELQEGRYKPKGKTGWAAFREQYERDHLPSLAEHTAGKVRTVFNWVEETLHPTKLADLNEARLAYLQSQIRKAKVSEATIKGYLAHLKAALRWAVRMKLLDRAPAIEMPKRARGQKVMKGRPITAEELDRMIEKLPAVLFGKTAAADADRPAIIASWEFYLRGMWASGLRRTESLELYWDRPDRLCVDLADELPMLHVPAALEKGNRDRLLPLAPEFAEFLQAVPEARRRGPVFSPRPSKVGGRLTPDWVSRVVSALGEKAGVIVAVSPTTGKKKYASLHDLRRSFGERWAGRVLPQVLMELMRHEAIETTLRFYVGRNAKTTARALWDAHRAATQKPVADFGPICGPTPDSGDLPGQEASDATH